jgi:hypothetical protein
MIVYDPVALIVKVFWLWRFGSGSIRNFALLTPFGKTLKLGMTITNRGFPPLATCLRTLEILIQNSSQGGIVLAEKAINEFLEREPDFCYGDSAFNYS